jgi:hypothetical protein
VIYLTCGPTHFVACGFVPGGNGAMTTDASGYGVVTITVPTATLQELPYGCGERSDHIDSVIPGIS